MGKFSSDHHHPVPGLFQRRCCTVYPLVSQQIGGDADQDVRNHSPKLGQWVYLPVQPIDVLEPDRMVNLDPDIIPVLELPNSRGERWFLEEKQ
jgi:hypothetical protein